VRFGLNAIKGIPGGAIRAIVEERRRRGPFSSFFDFIDRADLKAVTRATIESLVKCGAFDALHSAAARAAMIESIESTLAAAQQAADDRRTGQMNFFGSLDAAAAPGPDAAGPAPQRRLPATPPWDTISTLAREKEALGFHVSGHPLDRFDDTITAFATCTIRELAERPHDARVVVAGVLGRVRMTLVRNGQAAGEKMAVISVQDRAASIEGVVFSSVFARDAARLRPETPVLLIGRVDRMRGEVQIIVEQVLEMHEAPLHLTDRLELDLVDEPEGEPIAPTMEMVAGLLRQSAALAGSNGGRPAEVIVRLWTGGQRITLRAARLRVVPDAHLLDRLREAVGEAGVRCVGGLPPPADRRGGGAGAAARRRAEPVPV
jgi:DNA polymerase-3 subunit alpha